MKRAGGRWLILAVVLSVLSGCSIGPDYVRPDIVVPESFAEARAAQGAESVTLARWWSTLGDPRLTTLIEEAANANLDLQLALARLREARGLLTLSYSGFLPDVTTTASFSRSKASENARTSVSGAAVSGDGDAGSEDGTPSTLLTSPQTLYEAGFDAAWEIDIFGGTRREVEAARGAYEAQIEAVRDVLVSVLSEVATNYVLLRGLQRELEITENNVTAQRETLEIEEMRLDAGLTSELTVAQARAQLQSTLSRIPALQTPIQQTIHRLSILIGRDPGALQAELQELQPVPQGPAEFPVGIPSDLLRRRPDIRRAERELAAATANIGVAMADFFPRLELNGTFGVRSRSSGSLFESGSRFWSWGPSVRWEILNWQAVLSNIEVQDARQEQALITYRRAILQSLGEVENALLAYRREQERRQALAESVEANRKALRLAIELNTAGVADFLNVLNAQRAVYEAEGELVRSERDVAANLVALYKALGGGWEK